MIIVERTSSQDPELLRLIKLLDEELAIRDGKDHAFYAQYNGLETIQHILLLKENNKTLACGALKRIDSDHAEIKRMFVIPEERNKGMASKVLHALEEWAKDLGFLFCRLETGINQPEAIRLYEKNGYLRIPNYGQYKGVEASFCFQKEL
jgi:GNAT superfamily N-acetyltransferase